jgi:hypothetical protein
MSPYQVLLNAYPGKLTSNDGVRVQVRWIRHCENPDDLMHLQSRLADILSTIDEDFLNYTREARERQESAATGDDDNDESDPTDEPEDIPEAIRRRRDQDSDDEEEAPSPQSDTIEKSYSAQDIELAELTEHSEPVAVPYPRAYRCPDSCGHFMILSPDDVRSGSTCVHHRHTYLRRFPYVFVCPRCARYEQASPHSDMQRRLGGPEPEEVLPDDIDRSQDLQCPDDQCDGHLHVHLGDRLWNVFFYCQNCNSQYQFHGNCPECHKPSTSSEPAIQSEYRPKPIDSQMTDSLLIDDIESDRGTTLEELRTASAEDATADRFHWNLDTVATGTADTIRDTFAVNDVFTVEQVNSISAVYGYQATVSSRNTDFDQHGRLARTFRSDDRERRAYLTRREGRAIVIELDSELVAEVVSEGETDDYSAIARRELEQLEDMSADEMSEDESLRLIPLLHAYQHAFYDAAIEEAGLEDFLSAKMLVEDGALVFAEQRQVGAGGLSQVTMNQTGRTLLDVFQRTEEILNSCSRSCNDACLACVFIDDAKCHPFVSRELESYVPANSLLNRDLAAQVMRRV